MAFAKQTKTATAHEVAIRTPDGGEAGRCSLAADLFGIEPNVAVMHQVVTAQLAAARRGTQSTKTRAEVSGGGRKPFKQKGTGRARQGSERAPQFIGGGIALGPKPRSYRQKTPKKMIALALRSALSDRAAEDRVVVVQRWGWDTPSTKSARQALEALGLYGKVLVVLGNEDEVARKSFRNLPAVQLVKDTELNAYDILVNDWVVFSEANLPGVAEETVAAARDLVDGAEAAEETAAVEEVTEAVEAAELITEAAELEAEHLIDAASLPEEPADEAGADEEAGSDDEAEADDEEGDAE
jgi:large subunit ribosomal protein L4